MDAGRTNGRSDGDLDTPQEPGRPVEAAEQASTTAPASSGPTDEAGSGDQLGAPRLEDVHVDAGGDLGDGAD